MARKLDVGIEIQLDDNGAVKKVKNLNKGMREMEPSANQATAGLSRMKNMIGGIGLALVATKMARWLKDSTEAAAEQQRVFNSLAVGLGNAGVAYNDVGRELQNMFTHLQETTTYGDTDTAQALQKLVVITGDYDAALKLLEPTLDFATAMNIDLATAARLSGQAATGMTGTLSRYGIVLSDVVKEEVLHADAMGKAEIMARELAKRFGGSAAAELQDYGGRIKQVGNYWGDFGEAIGDVIVKSAAAPGVFDKVIDGIKGMIDWAKAFGEVVVFFTNLDFGAAIQAYAKKATAAYLRLFSAVYGMLKKLPEWLGGGKKAAGMEQALEIAAAVLEKMADIDLTKVFDDANEAALTYRDAVDNITASASGPGGLVEALEEVGTTGEDAFGKMMKTAESAASRMNAAVLRSFRTLKDELASGAQIAHMTTEDLMKGMEESVERSTDVMVSTFSDMLGKGFMGEWTTFRDLWDAAWKDAAKSMTGILGDAFEDWMSGGREGGLGGLMSNFKESIERNRLGAGIGGAGMMMQGREQGGTGGALQGAMGGAMLGTSILPGWGTAIGAIVGGLMGAFGGGDDPRTGATLGAGGFSITSTQGQDLGPGAWVTWEKNMNSLLRESKLAYRGLLQLFGDEDLFDLVGSLGGFTIDRAGNIDDLAAYIAEEWLPDQMNTAFGQAMRRGFGDLGLGEGEIDNLFAELGNLGGADRIAALQDVISALVMFSNIFEDFGSGGALLDLMDQGPMEKFAADMAEVRGQIDLVTVGWENMSLPDRAREAEQIGVLFAGALQTTLNMLQQIEGVRQSINQNFGRLDEDLRVGGMGQAGKERYYRQRITTLTGELGGATSADEIARISAEIQRYIQSLSGIVDLDATGSITGGATWRDFIRDMIAQASEAANVQLDEIEDEVLGEYDALIARMQEAEDALTGFTEAVAGATGGGAGGAGGAGGEDPGDPKNTTVNIIIDGSIAPLLALIDARITTALGDGGPGAIQ